MGWDWLSKVIGLLRAPLVLIKTLMFIGRKVGTIEYFIKCMDANMLCAKSVQRNICFHKDLQSVLLCSQHFKTFNLSLSTRNICFNIKMRSDSFQNWEEEEDSFLFQGTTLRLRSRPSEALLFTKASFLSPLFFAFQYLPKSREATSNSKTVIYIYIRVKGWIKVKWPRFLHFFCICAEMKLWLLYSNFTTKLSNKNIMKRMVSLFMPPV